MSISMSDYNKMVKKRDLWRNKTALAKAENRYRRKENKRFKRERDQYRQDLRQKIDALQLPQKTLQTRVINDKENPLLCIFVVPSLYLLF